MPPVAEQITIESIMYAALTQINTLRDKVNDRIYSALLPSNTGYPAVSFNMVSYQTEEDLQGPTGLIHCRVQVDAWGKASRDATLIRDIIRKALAGFRGQLGGATVQYISFEGAVTLYDKEAALHHQALDFLVSFEEVASA